MKFLNWKIKLSISLIGLSLLIYLLNYLVFQDVGYMSRLFLGQLGFLPISVLLVTIILNQLLAQRAKSAKLNKLYMVIGAFFSEVGVRLLKTLAAHDRQLVDMQPRMVAMAHWKARDFAGFSRDLAERNSLVQLEATDLETLRDFLIQKRDFLMRLLENPNLLEHDSFSDLLLSVFHLTEELTHRTDLSRLSAVDRDHLAGDVHRAYILLNKEWLTYMSHLQANYPYLFSLALRTNPLDPSARPEIE
ncbi:MAG: hypothetical protein JRL30_14760 [Deltaproteobacteria bacterium]|nr:hypothetical protein [Deltaproteobacteria bacterium]